MKFLSILCLAAILLGACGAQPAPLPDEQPATPTSALVLPTLVVKTTGPKPTVSPSRVATLGVKADELRGVQVSFWYAAGADLSKEMAAQLADFNRNNLWGITVEGRAFSSAIGLEEQIFAAEKSGGLPQATAAPLEMLLDWQARSQVLTPLDAYIRDPEWGVSAQEPADFVNGFWQDERVGGQQWGIPAGRNPHMLFYNQTWAESLGFRLPPSNPAEFRTQACAAAKANLADDLPENNGTGGWIFSNDPLALESWRRAFGGEALPVDEGKPYLFNSPPAVKAFTFLRKLADDNCAWTARLSAPYPYFAQRQALFYSGSLLDIPYQERAFSFSKSPDRWTVLPYPAEVGKPLSLADGSSYAMLRSTPQRQLAVWVFLHHLMLPRVQSRLAEAGGLLPAGSAALDLMPDPGRRAHPAWAETFGWKQYLQPAPRLSSWRTVRRVLQDAAWQIFSPATSITGISGVLSELDATLPDLLKLPK